MNDMVLFYEDSEGDLNVISEENDVTVAQLYSESKNMRYLKCNLVLREKFELMREEQ